MNDAQLEAFRQIAEAMHPEPHDWQWIGPHESQRMFGITQARAENYAAKHGGEAKPLEKVSR
jgi:hypothetical protein